MKQIVFFLMLIFLIPNVSAVISEGHITLLAAKEIREGYFEGSIATLYLEIKPGSGRVFMETFPLSKLDTQISTRFAKETACDYLDISCDSYDFFYTIRSDSSIIGGPSAGAAITVLTTTMLQDLEFRKDVAITGTINSGGLIGPVGGLRAKVDAAYENQITTVLVPPGGRFIDVLNLTLDLSEYAEKYNIKIIESPDLDEALYHFTGKERKKDLELEINPSYVSTMRYLAELLCNRSKNLEKQVSKIEYDEVKKNALNLTIKSEEALARGDYYSAASFCFGANIRYRDVYLRDRVFNDLNKIAETINAFEKDIEKREIVTLSDLQTKMIVKDRISEARNSLNRTIILKEKGEDYIRELAYTLERMYSAETWVNFFGIEGKEFNFDLEYLQNSCRQKISEAEERIQYVRLYYSGSLEGTREELKEAYAHLSSGSYDQCLFKASKAKAEIDVILGAIGVKEERLEEVLNIKLKAVRGIIAREQSKGVFPIAGYSYYEYAQSLKEDNIYSALLYAQYALELSKLDVYFEEKETFSLPQLPSEFIYLIIGLVAGGLIGYGLQTKKKAIKKVKKKISKKKPVKKK